VGQCGADHGSISRTLSRHLGATVESADSAAEAVERARQGAFDLILVNRVLDADGSSGLDVIRRLKGADGAPAVPVMLVSNYDDAQREAVAAGALPGFGKAALVQPAMLTRLRKVLGGEAPATG
jgi:CheY-like chemotaxis protein